MLGIFLNFILGFFRTAVSFFQGVPGKIALWIAALGAVVAECASFIDQISLTFSESFDALDEIFSAFARSVADNSFFSLFSYCLAFDVLVTILADVVSFVAIVLSFLFVGFVNAVLLFFGLKFGYQAYKFLLGVASNGLARA